MLFDYTFCSPGCRFFPFNCFYMCVRIGNNFSCFHHKIRLFECPLNVNTNYTQRTSIFHFFFFAYVPTSKHWCDPQHNREQSQKAVNVNASILNSKLRLATNGARNDVIIFVLRNVKPLVSLIDYLLLSITFIGIPFVPFLLFILICSSMFRLVFRLYQLYCVSATKHDINIVSD